MSKKNWKEGWRLAFYLRPIKGPEDGLKSTKVTVELMAMEPGLSYPRNLMPWNAGDYGQDAYLGGLLIQQYVDHSETRVRPSVMFGELYFTECPELMKRAKALEGFHKKMAKLIDNFGEPTTFGHYVLMAATAIGVEVFLTRTDDNRYRHSSYGDMTWEHHDAHTFARKINESIKHGEDLCKAYEGKAA